ncbi:hypothetical protein [Streptomyces regalis]|uniref:Uncharacterized protein n=1 Tax=Streptomyces regalis TaxID=68262 RepID=A0A0X3VHA9_9ACTN|nr:hypothetical protein [Streptomyces regalis]KUL44080.1 hypothetical protein ADL12_05925 [Streptomyces regalis]
MEGGADKPDTQQLVFLPLGQELISDIVVSSTDMHRMQPIGLRFRAFNDHIPLLILPSTESRMAMVPDGFETADFFLDADRARRLNIAAVVVGSPGRSSVTLLIPRIDSGCTRTPTS